MAAALLFAANAQVDTGRSEQSSFKSVTALVLVPVTVTNRRGALLNGLSKEQFDLQENKIRQKVSSFSEEDVPVSIGILFDASGSMKHSLDEARTVLRAFLNDANPEDEAFLHTVSSQPRREIGFTADFPTILSRTMFQGAYGSTALIDTIYGGLDNLRTGKHTRKALLVISDGMDNHSRYSKAELMSRALESDAQIYTISIYDPPAYGKPLQLQEERRGMNLLSELASQTGGISFVVRNPAEIYKATAQIARALRNQYVLGYIPKPLERSGRWRTIQVRVAVPNAKVYWRAGYRFD
jgi:Ca-activated chloride channel family protein